MYARMRLVSVGSDRHSTAKVPEETLPMSQLVRYYYRLLYLQEKDIESESRNNSQSSHTGSESSGWLVCQNDWSLRRSLCLPACLLFLLSVLRLPLGWGFWRFWGSWGFWCCFEITIYVVKERRDLRGRFGLVYTGYTWAWAWVLKLGVPGWYAKVEMILQVFQKREQKQNIKRCQLQHQIKVGKQELRT